MQEVKVIGQMDNTIDHTFESANRVYDDKGLSPTIPTCAGGGIQPKVMEIIKMNVEKIGFLEKGTGEHQSNIVYSKEGISPCVCAGMGVKQQPTMTVETKVIGRLDEKQIVAMRGRNPENPSDRTAGIHLEQRLEPNSENICNTLTSVQKDNLVMETTSAKVLRMIRTEEGKSLRKAYENGEIHHGFNEYRQAEPRKDGCSNTLSTVQKDNHILETKYITIRQATKDGFINCEIVGGMRLELSDKQDTQRESSKEWSSESYSDNGEYP